MTAFLVRGHPALLHSAALNMRAETIDEERSRGDAEITEV
jgi:hypothetical protein